MRKSQIFRNLVLQADIGNLGERMKTYYSLLQHKMLIILGLIALIGLAPTLLIGDEIGVSSSISATKIGVEDHFTYTVTVESASREELKVDIKLDGFEADYARPKVSNSFASSFTNGKFSSSRTQTYSYTVYVREVGTLAIPQFTVIVNGKKYSTQAHEIEVVEGTLRMQQQQQSRQRSRSPFGSFFDQGFDAFDNAQRSAHKSFIEAEMSRDSLYVGQDVQIKYFHYTTSNQHGVRYSIESSDGYGIETRESTDDRWLRATVKGTQYLKREIVTLNVTAQQTGVLSMPKIVMTEDSFFNRNVVKSPEKKLIVKGLPQKGKAIDFSNAIGRFTMKSELNQNLMFDNQQNQLIVTIKGKGNFKNILYPKFQQVDGLEILKPQAVLDIDADGSGKLILTYDIIASASGKFRIPDLSFNYFDDKLEQYQTIYSGAHLLTVKSAATSQNITVKNNHEVFFSRNQPYLGTIRHEYLITNKTIYWVLLSLYLLVMIGYIFFYRHQKKQMSNVGFVRRKEGLSTLKKFIDEAKCLVEQNDLSFYTKAQNNLLRFISITTKASLQSSQQELIKELEKSSVASSTVEKINAFLTHCEQIKYRPNFQAEENIIHDFKKYQDIYHEIRNN